MRDYFVLMCDGSTVPIAKLSDVDLHRLVTGGIGFTNFNGVPKEDIQARADIEVHIRQRGLSSQV